ncbi:MAG: 8-oxo-dGTP diphosphatase [Ignavibacteriales bacterium]|nr:8-oxo-dGTP diphosphatase [Ignavibacteriales bacterium]
MKLATLCYVKDETQNKTLMLHRVKKENDMHEGKWNGLGGKFEPGETPEECAIREIHEESGLTITNPTFKGVITFPEFDGIEDWYVFMFVSKEFSGSLIESKEGNLAWIDDDKLLELNLWEGDRIFIPWLDSGFFFSAKFVYKDKKLVSHDVSFY